MAKQAAKKVPLRQCVGCGEMKSKKEMLRVLKTAEDEIVLDATGKKNGRGAYICFSKECLKKARKNKGLERSFKMSIPEEIYERLEKEFDEIEAELGIVLAGPGSQIQKCGERRIRYGELGERGQSQAGDGGGGCF